MSLENQLEDLEDPLFQVGDKIIDQIVDNFSDPNPNRLLGGVLAIQYATYLACIASSDTISILPDGVTPAGPIDYARWTQAVNEALRGNWETMATKIETFGKDFITGSERYIENVRFGTALVNLGGCLKGDFNFLVGF